MEINKKPIALQSVGRDPIRQSISYFIFQFVKNHKIKKKKST